MMSEQQSYIPFDYYKRRKSGGTISRFKGGGTHTAVSREDAALRVDHPAVLERRSVFQKSVKSADEVPRVLVSGHSNAKTGATVLKGVWAGMPIFTLTLEERRTCPPCDLKRECYGNGMPYARRNRAGPGLEAALARELADKAVEFPKGFVVRLHVLGDFYSVEYVRLWRSWLKQFPQLHVWGYTAHDRDSWMGKAINANQELFPKQWAVRFSVRPSNSAGLWKATTIWREPEGPVVAEGQVCPAQREHTATCGTCGLCWDIAMRNTTIVFLGHGARRGRRAGTKA